MAKYSEAVFGTIRGRVGEGIGVLSKGLKILKGLSSPSSVPPSLAQLSQRARWGLVTPFISTFTDIINLGWKAAAGSVSKSNTAVSYHIANAVTGVYPDLKIDYPKLKFSNVKDTIDTVLDPVVTALAGNVLKVTWETISAPNKKTKLTDLLVILFYSPELNRYMSTTQGCIRSDLEMEMQMSRIFIGKKVHGYLFFMSEDGKFTSATEYLGEFTPIA